MSLVQWSDTEIITAVYFTLRGFDPEIVAEFLAQRQFPCIWESIDSMLFQIT